MKTYVLSLALFLGLSSSAQNLIKEGAELQKIEGKYQFTEGPIADAKGNVYFTDIPPKIIYKYTTNGKVTVYKKDVLGCNGLFFDNDSNLVVCGNGQAQKVWKLDMVSGAASVLADQWEGVPFNGPNDLWIDKKGGIYFTDPRYGKRDPDEQKIGSEDVYYIQANGKVIRVIDDFVRPNGIIATPNGKTLYVADIDDSKVWKYRVNKDGTLSNKKFFAPERCDGMTMDEMGNLYFTLKGVVIYNKKGKKIDFIEIPGGCTNVCFGGKDRKTLFVTGKKYNYTLQMNVAGVY